MEQDSQHDVELNHAVATNIIIATCGEKIIMIGVIELYIMQCQIHVSMRANS